MKKNILISILLFLMILPLWTQHLFTERSAKRGEIINAFIYPAERIGKSRFTLLDKEGRIVSHSDGFTVHMGENEVTTALMGIPSDAVPGRYTLQAFCETEEGSEQFSKPFFVGERDFIEMDINLNGDMSDLRNGNDPRKAEQSRHLWTVLSSFDSQADYNDGMLITPVKDYVETAFFGDRRMYLYADGTNSNALHNGADLAAPVGEPVYAAGDGKVVMAEFRILTGNTVVIEHLPGVFTLYYHLNELSIEPEMLIKSGRQIGTVGMTGLVTGPHLHWELRVSGVAVDPIRYMEVPLIDKEQIINIITSIH